MATVDCWPCTYTLVSPAKQAGLPAKVMVVEVCGGGGVLCAGRSERVDLKQYALHSLKLKLNVTTTCRRHKLIVTGYR